MCDGEGCVMVRVCDSEGCMCVCGRVCACMCTVCSMVRDEGGIWKRVYREGVGSEGGVAIMYSDRGDTVFL